jgi:glycosidase
MSKILIYQVLPRLFGNDSATRKRNGSIDENGCGKMAAFDDKALQEIRKMGFTHIWYTGIMEHATKTDYSRYGIRGSHPDTVKGIAGSPYAVRDAYDISPDLATDVTKRMDEFEALVKRTHESGLNIIIDFVPNHVAREYFSDAKPANVEDFGAGDNPEKAFHPDNNFYYIPGQALEFQFPENFGKITYSEFPAKASGNDNFTNKPTFDDWYETVKLNYGIDYPDNRTAYFSPVPDTWNKMRDILIYWTEKGIDGFRCDMAEMVPVEFWSWVIPQVKAVNKSLIFIAEIYQPALYCDYVRRGNFDFLYDKVDLYDTLRNIVCNFSPASELTGCWQRIDGLQSYMLNFLETHDEQRIASDFYIGNPVKAIPAMIVAATINVNPVLIYFGQELGEKGMDNEGYSGLDGRTTIFDYWSPDTVRVWRNGGRFDGKNMTAEQSALRDFYIRLLHLCNEEEAISNGKFFDLMYLNNNNPQFDPSKQYAFLRYHEKSFLLIVANFSEKTTVHVNITPDVFSFMNIDLSEIATCENLLYTKSRPEKLNADWTESLMIEMDAYSGKILKFAPSDK